MKTRFEQNAYGVVASVFLLMALTGCGSSVVPLTSNSATTSSLGGLSNSTSIGSTSTSTGTTTGTGTTGTGSTGTGTPGTGTGTGSTVTSTALTVTTPWSNARLAEGDSHSCLLDTSGGVWCWGYNNSGQIGNGTMTTAKYVTRAATLTTGAQMIAAGGYHTCALDSTRSVWCWGANESGQLGNGTMTMSETPVRVSILGSGVQSLALGFQHSCAVDASGVMWCWGNNAYGQLGNGTTSNSDVPVPTMTEFAGGAQSISMGYHHSCATNGIGALYCWGYNNSGRLGDGTVTDRHVPTLVSNMASGIQAVSAGYVHTCAVDASGVFWCWGDNTYGELGDSSFGTGSLYPQAVKTLSIGVQTIALGGYHTCVSDGTHVNCWGDDKYGQAGSATYTNQFAPIAVAGLSAPIRGLASGGFHTCVLDSVGMQCWGYNGYDELGDGTYTNNGNPVQVFNVSPPN